MKTPRLPVVSWEVSSLSLAACRSLSRAKSGTQPVSAALVRMRRLRLYMKSPFLGISVLHSKALSLFASGSTDNG
jgi:hypothetical protein